MQDHGHSEIFQRVRLKLSEDVVEFDLPASSKVTISDLPNWMLEFK